MKDMGWTEPTPIQVGAIPYGNSGRDMLAQAQTGTGKTGTYGSIILDRIEAGNGWAKALVLTPTRELALQVSEEMGKLSKYSGHRCIPVYGGVSIVRQTKDMDRGADIIIATPGRLCDHLRDDESLLEDISIIVLDEADRMLDMGFKRDLEFILGKVPEDRQTMLFSATMAENVRDLAMKHLVKPKEIRVSTDEPVLDLITQRYMGVEKDDKIDMLRYVLAKEPMKTIVFCFTRYRVDRVVRKLKMSFRVAGIHGDVPQNRRERILGMFREGKIDILVASDLAARGLDIDNVSRVINMDMPPEVETYVHRIGRTGRAGKKGLALSFVMSGERKLLKDIERETSIPLERMVAPSDKEMEEVCSGIKDLPSPVLAKKNSRKNDVPVADKEFVAVEINIGKADGQTRTSISQLFRDYTKVPKKSIGNIVPGERTSDIEIEGKYVKDAADGISKCIVRGRSVSLREIERSDDFAGKKSEVRRTPTVKVSSGGRDGRQGSGDREKAGERRGRHDRPASGEISKERSRGYESSGRATPSIRSR